jgi:hypothetical protein
MGARPKLAYIINSLEGGGAQSPVPDILSVLQANGFDVQFYALTRRNGKAIEASGFSPIIRPGGEKDHLAAVKWLMDELGKWPADIIWTSLSRATLLGQIVGQRLGLPVVSWQHNAFLKPWNERLLRWRARASALWVADSHLVAQLTHERLGIAKDNLLTWSIFSADESAPTAAPWQKGETLRIGSLGRYHRAKGFDILMHRILIIASFWLAKAKTGMIYKRRWIHIILIMLILPDFILIQKNFCPAYIYMCSLHGEKAFALPHMRPCWPACPSLLRIPAKWPIVCA